MYNYDKVIYKNNYTNVCLIDNNGNEIYKNPRTLLNKSSNNTTRKYTTETFIQKAKEIHGDYYDYSKVNYVNSTTKICIICPIHGEFYQIPSNHLKGQNCPKCSNRGNLGKDEFIRKADIKYNNYYDYSKVNYINSITKVCIICPIHGEFYQTPASHLQQGGCLLCSREKLNSNTYNTRKNTFITKATNLLGNLYDYSNINYVNSYTPIKLICDKHGEFEITPGSLLHGCKCPKCTDSVISMTIRSLLEKLNIVYKQEQTFEWLVNKSNNRLKLDFYIPSKMLAIECQGHQHFKPVKLWNGIQGFKERQENDKIKYELCRNNGIQILYFSDTKVDNYIDVVYTEVSELEKVLTNY